MTGQMLSLGCTAHVRREGKKRRKETAVYKGGWRGRRESEREERS
jgi:hypothetical protein